MELSRDNGIFSRSQKACILRKNGSTQMQTSYPTATTGNYAYMLQVHGLINLDTAGDYVEVRVDCDQQSGEALNINYNAGTNRTEFGGYKVA